MDETLARIKSLNDEAREREAAEAREAEGHRLKLIGVALAMAGGEQWRASDLLRHAHDDLDRARREAREREWKTRWEREWETRRESLMEGIEKLRVGTGEED